jgi:LacI family transcriptional regulator
LEVNHQTVVNWLRDAAAEAARDNSAAALAEAPSSSVRPESSAPAPATADNDPDAFPADATSPAPASPPIGWPATPELPDRKRATIADVARHADVSTSTISNYLNHRGHMSSETRNRVEAAIEELHFTPSALMRAIRHRRTRIFGVLLFGLGHIDMIVGNSLAPQVLAGINGGATRADYGVLLYPDWQYKPRTQVGLPFLDGHIDGLLWVSPYLDDPTLARVAAAGLPTVALLARRGLPGNVGSVCCDNFGAMRQLVDHLVAQGHRRIAFVGPAHDSDFLERWDGYWEALSAAGLQCDPELGVLLHDADKWAHPAYVAVLERWIALPDPPTAILLPSDGLSDAMIQDIRAHGLRVPEDIAITGFDDIPDAAYMGGGLTSVRQPFREIGLAGVDRLLALIEGAPVEECRVVLPTRLSVRASTAFQRRP